MHIKNIYRLHRILSIIIGIPIFLWAVSGLMHPLMTSVRPKIATQTSPGVNLTPSVLENALPVKTVLENAGIRNSYKIHMIQMPAGWFYQVLIRPGEKQQASSKGITSATVTDTARYFNVHTGIELASGDSKYAAFLARHFLGTEKEQNARKTSILSIQSIERITQFNDQYAYVNRLLPVYKVAFNRADQIAIFVDTHNSRFAFALDQDRATFNRFFGWFHTWSWMDSLPKLKAAIIAMILLVALFTAGLGLYLAFKTKSNKHTRTKNPINKARWVHRVTALIGAVFLLAWAFSGLVHALQKGRTIFQIRPVSNEFIQTADLPMTLGAYYTRLAKASPLRAISLFKMQGQLWIQTQPYATAELTGAKDLMKEKAVHEPLSSFYTLQPVTPITPGSSADNLAGLHYHTERTTVALMAACMLNNRSKSATPVHIDSSKLQYLTRFSEAYNFSDKILPVWQITLGTGVMDKLFIDAANGALVKKGDPFKQADALIFAFFHKHEFMAWAGKSAKDASTVIGILLLLTVLIVGYRLSIIKWWYKKKKNKE